MNISIIIPHKGREELLNKTVESLINQNINLSTIEIIVVTQNTKLHFSQKLNDSSSTILIFHLDEDKSISTLRNFGASQAKGKYLAFLDADVELDDDWLACMIKIIDSDETQIIISSTQKNSLQSSEVEQVRTALNNINTNLNVDSLPGSNLFMRRIDFQDSHKFPEHMKTCEDIYFTSELAKKGKLFVTGVTSHIHLGEDSSYRQLFKKEIWRGQSNLQSIKGRSIPLREIPSFIIPPGLLLLLTICIFALALDSYLIAFVSFILLIIPVIAYSFRLHNLTKGEVSFWYVFKFYLVYFPARAVGTIGGVFKSFTNSGIK